MHSAFVLFIYFICSFCSVFKYRISLYIGDYSDVIRIKPCFNLSAIYEPDYGFEIGSYDLLTPEVASGDRFFSVNTTVEFEQKVAMKDFGRFSFYCVSRDRHTESWCHCQVFEMINGELMCCLCLPYYKCNQAILVYFLRNVTINIQTTILNDYPVLGSSMKTYFSLTTQVDVTNPDMKTEVTPISARPVVNLTTHVTRSAYNATYDHKLEAKGKEEQPFFIILVVVCSVFAVITVVESVMCAKMFKVKKQFPLFFVRRSEVSATMTSSVDSSNIDPHLPPSTVPKSFSLVTDSESKSLSIAVDLQSQPE